MARTRPYHHGDLRAALLAAARARIAAGGVDAVAIRELARDIGVAHRAAYQHFADRDALIAAVFAEAYLSLATRAAAVAARRRAPARRLEAAGHAIAAFAFAEPRLFLAMTGPRINESGRFPELEAAIGEAWRPIAGPIAAGIASGAFTIADPRAAAAIFWGGLQGVLALALHGRLKLAPAQRDEFVGLVIERLIAGLTA